MDLALRGRRALITGGTGGIGSEIARTLGREGVRVAINYVGSSTDADALMRDLASHGFESLALAADVRAPDQVDAMFNEMDAKWGGIDILINNAGIDGKAAVAWEADPSDWMRVIEINLKGAFLCARAALQRMVKAHSGVILNTSSVHEEIAWTGYSAYVASKAGLSMMAKTLAQEAAPYGVRVLSIAPGAIRTPINASVWQNRAGHADLLTKIPLGRIGNASEIANMVAVLVSDVASYVTATSVFVDGGMTDFPSFAHGG